MLKRIREQQSINIPSFIKHIRKQRNYLVQTEEQFIFIYEVLLEVIQLINNDCNYLELNLENFAQHSNLTSIEKQFQLIISQTNTYDFQLLTEENSTKNRTLDILPSNPCRVILSSDSRYINASYIHVSV
jgi:protein tyrosine phosphatase